MKTNIKKKVSMLLATATCVTALAAGGGTALAAGGSFTDVSSGDWFHPAVSAMAEGGLVAGVGNGRFAPNEKLSVAAFSTIMCRATGMDTNFSNEAYWERIETYAPFLWGTPGFDPDVDHVHWGYGAVKQCSDANYIQSRGFAKAEEYDKPITREEAIAGMSMLNGPKGESSRTWTSNDIPDYDSISSQYREAIVKAYNKGVCTGVDTSGTFNPKGYLTRAQVAQLFYNIGITKAKQPGGPVSEMSSAGYMAPVNYKFSTSLWDTHQKATYSDGNTYTAEYVALLKDNAVNGVQTNGSSTRYPAGIYEFPAVFYRTFYRSAQGNVQGDSVTHIKITPEVDAKGEGNWVPVGEYVFDSYGTDDKLTAKFTFMVPYAAFRNANDNSFGLLSTVRFRVDDCYSADDGWTYRYNGSNEKTPILFSSGMAFTPATTPGTVDLSNETGHPALPR